MKKPEFFSPRAASVASLSRADANRVVNVVSSAIGDALADGGILRFGTFSTKSSRGATGPQPAHRREHCHSPHQRHLRSMRARPFAMPRIRQRLPFSQTQVLRG